MWTFQRKKKYFSLYELYKKHTKFQFVLSTWFIFILFIQLICTYLKIKRKKSNNSVVSVYCFAFEHCEMWTLNSFLLFASQAYAHAVYHWNENYLLILWKKQVESLKKNWKAIFENFSEKKKLKAISELKTVIEKSIYYKMRWNNK